MQFMDRIRTRAEARRRGSYLGERLGKTLCFSQHDMTADNGSGATVRADYNLALKALASQSSGATAPSTTFAYQVWADTTDGVLKQRNAANTNWIVRGPLAETMLVARSSNTIIAAGDFGKTFVFSSTFTQTLTAAATLGDGFMFRGRNDSTGIITVDANSTETIDGVQSVQLLPGDSCVFFCDGSNWKTIGRTSSAAPALVPGYLHGLTLSNNGTDAVNDIDVAAGVAIDSTGAMHIRLASGITKRLDAAWAVGTNQGGLDTGSIANDTYHVFVIKRSDTGVVDVLFSTSPTSPTMPTGYDFKRRIGSIIRAGATILAFSQMGDEFLLSVPVSDYAANNPGTSAVLRALTVPTDIQVRAIHRVSILDANSSAAGDNTFLVTSPDQADTAPSSTLFTVITSSSNTANEDNRDSAVVVVRTNTSGQIRTRLSLSDSDNTVWGMTYGWFDTRGRDA